MTIKTQTIHRSIKVRLLRVASQIINNDWLLSLVITAVLVASGIFLAEANNKVVPINPDPGAHYVLEPNNSLSFLAAWDGPDYLHIAQYGYTNAGQANFFPLYPMVTWVVDQAVGSLLISSLLVAWACLAGSIYFYLKLVKKLFRLSDNVEALRGVAFFVLFPTAVFLLASYSESLLAATALAGIYFALNKRYIPAAFCATAATATHITGGFVLLLITLLVWEAGLGLLKAGVTFLIGSLGLVSYMVYLWGHFHNPLQFVVAQQQHGWLKYSSEAIAGIGWLNVIFIALLVLAVIYWWSRRWSFSVYCLLFLTIPLAGQFGGYNRYVLMAFPLQFMLYGYLRERQLAYSLCLSLSAILWAYFLFQYAGGYVGG